jgi:Cu-Zn family superoxide dismutase
MKHLFNTRTTRILLSGVLTCSLIFFACKKKDKEEEMEDHVHKTAVAKIEKVFPDTVVTGTATFTQINDGDVTLSLDITVPSRANKSVAVHLHMMSDCGNNAGNAMGHWNPTNANHGKFGTGSFHLGDIGNITLDAKGHAAIQMTTNAWNINGSDATRNIVGRSVMIHSGVDDYVSQPTGNSGTKIGCGGIQAQ